MTNSKKIEIASDFYQKQIESINKIPQYHYKSIEEWLSSGSEVILQEFPSLFEETTPGIIIRH